MDGKENTFVTPLLIDAKCLCQMVGLGRTRAVEFARAAGAERRIGRRCLYDVAVLKKAVDNLGK